MTRITDTTEHVLRRVLAMSRLVASIEQHRIADQADAVLQASRTDSDRHGKGISDPTPNLVAALAPYAHDERRILAAIAAIDRQLDIAERQCSAVLAGVTDPQEHDDIRCPGWNAETRAKLGGCGKPLEHWTDAKGRQHNRATLLCISCRKAEERAQGTDVA